MASATLNDVAKMAGVSISTASRVLNKSDHPIADDTRQAVLEAAQKLRYRTNLVARSLRTDRTLTIGIIVENILSPFIPPIIRGIQDYLDKRNYLSIIINADWDPELEAKAIERLNRRQIDGMIFVESCIRYSEEVVELARKPHVFVHRLFDTVSPCSVVPDEREGGRVAVRHLIDLGHRRIGLVKGLESWDATAKRLLGYKDELAESGIPYDPDLVHDGDWGVGSGYQAALDLLTLDYPPTAIFAGNDLMALGVIYAVQDKGLSVPEDIAVVGYDDRDFAGFVRPGLTTVQMPCMEMGSVSAEILLNSIEKDIGPVDPALIPGQLIVRESCGGLDGSWDFEPERASFTRPRRSCVRSLLDTDGENPN